ncbi:hypothetical protein K3G39_03630 [Pontibacter sp. HSC-14F20]|uniref:hypothetical protein n=1 Tax=Pontibacter sp. HSC-14F20 TaxID=2864136 RepID=UPI001C72C75F|nr:hypothetical protein [Pontibacter sp. HSC-14F20]MBX0332318.1 hypothetical protein [Pontibacter sp. HSC-14F20]
MTQYLPDGYLKVLDEISLNDTETKSFLEWVNNHPDLSEEDIENQIIEMDKFQIEGQGFENFKRQRLTIYHAQTIEHLPEKVKLRLEKLQSWATEKGLIENKESF